MELRRYIRIVMRRWWIVVGLTIATALLSWLVSPLAQGSYQATLRVLLSIPPEQQARAPFYTYDRYYRFVATEFVVDDFIEVTRSQAFRDAVLKELDPVPTVPFSIAGQPRRERAPRIVTIVVSTSSAGEAGRIGQGVVRTLENRMSEVIGEPGVAPPIAVTIDPPVVTSASTGGRNYLNILLRAMAGMLAGLGIVFLLRYLDTTIYEAEEAAASLGLPVVLTIPPYPGDKMG